MKHLPLLDQIYHNKAYCKAQPFPEFNEMCFRCRLKQLRQTLQWLDYDINTISRHINSVKSINHWSQEDCSRNMHAFDRFASLFLWVEKPFTVNIAACHVAASCKLKSRNTLFKSHNSSNPSSPSFPFFSTSWRIPAKPISWKISLNSGDLALELNSSIQQGFCLYPTGSWKSLGIFWESYRSGDKWRTRSIAKFACIYFGQRICIYGRSPKNWQLAEMWQLWRWCP